MLDIENVRMNIELTDIYHRILNVIALMADNDESYTQEDALRDLTRIASKLQENIGELSIERQSSGERPLLSRLMQALDPGESHHENHVKPQ